MSPDVTAAGLLYAVRCSSVLALLNLFVLASLLWSGGSALAAEARIAVAANFRDTAEAIAARLEAESPHRYQVIAGSTGKLASQILNGAPFDVFMAADRQRPQQLVDRGLAAAASQQIYAVGELGLWWPSSAGTPTLKALGVFRLPKREVTILFHGVHSETRRLAAGKEGQPLTIDSGDTATVERVVYDSRKTILLQ